MSAPSFLSCWGCSSFGAKGTVDRDGRSRVTIPIVGKYEDVHNGEDLVMWWNFVGRSHSDIVGYREQWQQEDERFGSVDGYRGAVARLPAPPLPNATLRPRSNPGV